MSGSNQTNNKTAKSNKSKSDKDNNVDPTPRSEKEGLYYFNKLIKSIALREGVFLRDDDGSLHLIVEGRRILIAIERDNIQLNKLMIKSTAVTTVTSGARAAIQRLQVYGNEKAEKIHLKRFSSFSEDARRIYLPLDNGKLLLITANAIKIVHNGVNDDSFWVEHPLECPLRYSNANPIAGLEMFERLLVDSQSCQVPEMKWFVAIFAGLTPFIRDAHTARFLLEFIGPSQNGKTTGARRFLHLHGLGEVKGDFSVAALGNSPDEGLIVLDNKEQGNFGRELIDYCLFLATGAQRGRSSQDGTIRRHSKTRPIVIITTIEGVPKEELKNRRIRVEYVVSGEKFDSEEIQREIKLNRHEILSSLVPVLQKYLEIRDQNRDSPNPVPEFIGFFKAGCNLLRAYADVANKPEGWTESIIAMWDSTIRGEEKESNDLEQKIYRVFSEYENGQLDIQIERKKEEYEGKKGILYIIQCADLLSALHKLYPYDQMLPKEPSAFGRRLRNGLQYYILVDQNSKLEVLKRKGKQRVLGFFVKDEDNQ